MAKKALYFALGLASLVASGCVKNVLESPEYLELQSKYSNSQTENSGLEETLVARKNELILKEEELQRIKDAPPEKIEVPVYREDLMNNGAIVYEVNQEAHILMVKSIGLFQYLNSKDGGNTIVRLNMEEIIKLYGRANNNGDNKIDVEEAKIVYKELREKVQSKE